MRTCIGWAHELHKSLLVMSEDTKREKLDESRQVPWSLNCCALAFLSEAVKDEEYLRETWSNFSVWNVEMREAISHLFPHWMLPHPHLFQSWLWIQVGDQDEAATIVDLAKRGGVPVRWGKYGYNLPEYIRLAVRPSHLTIHLFEALSPAIQIIQQPKEEEEELGNNGWNEEEEEIC